MFASGQISVTQLISDNEALFRKLKEEDWDFYVKAKYGNLVNPDILFNQRVRNGVITLFIVMIAFIGKMSAITLVISLAAGFGVFKFSYMDIKSYYKKHIN